MEIEENKKKHKCVKWKKVSDILSMFCVLK